MGLKVVKTKRDLRLRRATKARSQIKRLGAEKGVIRLTIHRSLQHIYAQILAPLGGKVLAQASTLELRSEPAAKKSERAKQVGALLAKRAIEAGVAKVACDRSGFRYHGRVAALVDGLREHGVVV